MIETSATYKALRQDMNAVYEVQIIRGNVTYGMDKIKSCTIKHSLFEGSGPQIGATISARCDLVIMEQSRNWPRMASFEVKVRLTNGVNTSEWISFGIFYTDERVESSSDLTITAFDGMLLLEQSWTDKVSEQSLPEAWPITAKAAADLLVEASGVQYAAGVELDDTYEWFGLDTTSTVRESWANIAAAMGGNVLLTRDGKIRIVPINSVDSGSSAVAGVAIAGIAIVGTDMTEQEKAVDRIDLGFKVQSFDTSESFPAITGVELSSEKGSKAVAGTDAGYMLLENCEFSDVNVATLCLSKVQWYIYKPYTAGGTELDPAADLGDIVIVKNQEYQVFTTSWTLGKFIDCDISAPYDAEVDHEYTKESEFGKTYRKAVAASSEYSDRKLSNFITTTYASDLQNITQQIDGKADTWYQETDPSIGWTAAQKAEHVGDIWYDTVNELTFIWNGTDWEDMTTEIPQEIFDKIDGKAQIFITTPTPPYNIGDLWFDGEAEGIRTCIIAKGDNGIFSENDWQERNKYTDDTTANAAISATEELASEYRAFRTEIEQTVEDVTISVVQVNDNLDELKMHYRFDADGETIGKTDSSKSMKLSNDGIDMLVNNESVTHWNQDEMVAPRKVNIPIGGSLQLGNFLWQPRSSGNMSLLWVGD